jgi:hypothetical protein
LFGGLNNRTRMVDSHVCRTASERSDVAESGRKRTDERAKDLMAQRLHPARAQEEHEMSFATAADRIRSDFNEMPGLELTIGQGVRLWNLGADDCRNVLDALVDAGFLQWTTKRTIVRAGNDRHRDGMNPASSYISVRQSKPSDISIRRP